MADGESHLRWLNRGWYIVIPMGVVIAGATLVYSVPFPLLYLFLTYFNYYLCRFQDCDDDLYGASSSEGRLQREAKSVNFFVGYLASFVNGYKNTYAYLCNSIGGGHRGPLSHWFVLGASFRMVYYNLPPAMFLGSFFAYGAGRWGWIDPVQELYLDIWAIPYAVTQLITWNFADSIHIILDMAWAEGVLWQRKEKKK